MSYAGQKPGAGAYECDNCSEITILTDSSDELPFCPYCNSRKFLSYQYDLYMDRADDEIFNQIHGDRYQ